MRAKFINETMTEEDHLREKDLDLIAVAKKMNNIDWAVVYDMAKHAYSEETRQELLRISKTMYHNEEHSEGNM